jgi:hypothetical protein
VSNKAAQNNSDAQWWLRDDLSAPACRGYMQNNFTSTLTQHEPSKQRFIDADISASDILPVDALYASMISKEVQSQTPHL